MFAQLGSIIFDTLIGPESYQRSNGVSYAEHELINQKPRSQMTGFDLQSIDLSISFHDDFCDPETEIAAIETLMLDRTVLPYILGTGRYVGDFYIKSISENVKQAYPDGKVKLASLTISLKESVETKSDSDKAKDKATALSSNNPNSVRGQLRSYQTPEGQLTTSTVFAQAMSKEIDKDIKKESAGGVLSAHNIERIREKIDALSNQVALGASILAGNTDLTAIAPNMPSSLSASLTAALNLKTSLGGSTGATLGFSQTLQNTVAMAKQDGAKVIAKYLNRVR